MSLTPYQRWQKRTNDGREMSGGWTHAKYDPPKIGQYEVQGHPRYGCLTWAYGSWWHQSIGDDQEGASGSWHCQEGRWNWKGPKWNACSVNWGSVMHQAADAGNENAIRDIEKARKVWKETVS